MFFFCSAPLNTRRKTTALLYTFRNMGQSWIEYPKLAETLVEGFWTFHATMHDVDVHKQYQRSINPEAWSAGQRRALRAY